MTEPLRLPSIFNEFLVVLLVGGGGARTIYIGRKYRYIKT